MPSDRDKVLALVLEKAMECPQCGTRLEEWEEDRYAYHPESYRCPGCEHVQYEEGSWKEEGAKGIRVRLVPKGERLPGKVHRSPNAPRI